MHRVYSQVHFQITGHPDGIRKVVFDQTRMWKVEFNHVLCSPALQLSHTVVAVGVAFW